MSKKIKVYRVPGCPFYKKNKGIFKKQGLEF
jgi:hypothetical protein